MATDGSHHDRPMYDAFGSRSVETESFDKYNALYSRSNEREMLTSALDKIASEYNMDSVKSCLAIGPNVGFREIGFVEKCTANATKFIAIELGHKASELLKDQLRDRLPHVEGLVIEGDFRYCKGPSEPVDLVLMFHCLYPEYFKDPSERRSLMRKAHDRWLTAGGLMAVLVEGGWSSNTLGKATEIYYRLGYSVAPWEDMEADILDAGFIKKHVHEFQYMQDFTNPDEAFLRFFEDRVGYTASLDDIRSAMKELYRDKKHTRATTHFFCLRKHFSYGHALVIAVTVVALLLLNFPQPLDFDKLDCLFS